MFPLVIQTKESLTKKGLSELLGSIVTLAKTQIESLALSSRSLKTVEDLPLTLILKKEEVPPPASAHCVP